MPTKLTEIILDEISLVDKGSNPHAHVILMKRDGGDTVSKIKKDKKAQSFDDALKDLTIDKRIWQMLDALYESIWSIRDDNSITNKAAAIRDTVVQFHNSVAELAKEIDMADQDKDILKQHTDLVAKVAIMETEARGKDDTITKLTVDLDQSKLDLKKALNPEDREGFNKDELPEAVKKHLDKQDAQNKANTEKIQKMEEDSLQKDWITKCSTEDSAKLMFKIAKLDPELAAQAYALIAAAEAAVKEAGLFNNEGNEGEGDGTVLDKVNKMADDLVKSENITHAVAITKVMKQNPGLYAEYRKESST